MHAQRTKSLEGLEEKMQGIADKDSLRYRILDNTKNFKTSWVELGQALYTVWKDKLYKDWGYGEFNIYTAKEIGIRKETALKLLRSYYFLEKEEPVWLKQEFTQAQDAALVPTLEAVGVLRTAKNKKLLDAEDYARIKSEIFEKGKDAREVKRSMGILIRERQELDPEEAQQKKKNSVVKRLVGTLKSLKNEVEILKLLPASLVKETEDLIKKLEYELD
ncbi:MAG: hypothetical protein MUC39_01100 [Candidatus Omnitrophica bacterium]|jgi:hypothetical protein|nr:hypothetical protein [Candidatus Omnitrophota bacterium]